MEGKRSGFRTTGGHECRRKPHIGKPESSDDRRERARLFTPAGKERVSLITAELIQAIREQYVLHWNGVHGPSHWERVRENGQRLAALTGASPGLVELFAFVHDSCRTCDGADPDHGRRAGEFARTLAAAGTVCLAPTELEILVRACALHTTGRTDPDITVLTCWDADRLDLGRVGMRPDPAYLCTAPARSPALIRWAYARSIGTRS